MYTHTLHSSWPPSYIKVQTSDSDTPQDLQVEGVFIYVAGSRPITDFLTDEKIQLKEDGGVVVNDEMATSMPGMAL